MSTAIKVILGFIVSIIVVFIIGCGAIIGVNNNCVRLEEKIEAQYKQNQNNYDNYFKKLKEIAQVPSMYANDLKKLWDGVMRGRYGGNGSKATWQWLKEKNPQLDVSLYKKIQSVIEAGRSDFEQNQKMLLDMKREYKVYIKTFPTGFIAKILGYPEKDLDKMDIVTSEETDKMFKTKKSNFIKL